MRLTLLPPEILYIIFSLLPLTTSTCTNWTTVPSQPCPQCFTSYTIPITTITCAESNTNCTPPHLTYLLSAHPHIDIPVPLQINISLPDSDASSIYRFARLTPRIPFISLNGSVNTNTIPKSERMFEPGTSNELRFVPFMNAVSGVPGGCEDGTVDGVVVKVLAPTYRDEGDDSILGTWEISSRNLTGDAVDAKEKESNGRLGREMGWMYAAMSGLGLSAVCLSVL